MCIQTYSDKKNADLLIHSLLGAQLWQHKYTHSGVDYTLERCKAQSLFELYSL